MVQLSNKRPIRTKSQYFPPIGLYSGLEDQNRLEVTSHQKFATDGASSESTPTHTDSLYHSHLKLG